MYSVKTGLRERVKRWEEKPNPPPRTCRKYYSTHVRYDNPVFRHRLVIAHARIRRVAREYFRTQKPLFGNGTTRERRQSCVWCVFQGAKSDHRVQAQENTAEKRVRWKWKRWFFPPRGWSDACLETLWVEQTPPDCSIHILVDVWLSRF